MLMCLRLCLFVGVFFFWGGAVFVLLGCCLLCSLPSLITFAFAIQNNNNKRASDNNNKQYKTLGGGMCWFVVVCLSGIVLLCVFVCLCCVPCPRYSPSPLQYKNQPQTNNNKSTKRTYKQNKQRTTYWGGIWGEGWLDLFVVCLVVFVVVFVVFCAVVDALRVLLFLCRTSLSSLITFACAIQYNNNKRKNKTGNKQNKKQANYIFGVLFCGRDALMCWCFVCLFFLLLLMCCVCCVVCSSFSLLCFLSLLIPFAFAIKKQEQANKTNNNKQLKKNK